MPIPNANSQCQHTMNTEPPNARILNALASPFLPLMLHQVDQLLLLLLQVTKLQRQVVELEGRLLDASGAPGSGAANVEQLEEVELSASPSLCLSVSILSIFQPLRLSHSVSILSVSQPLCFHPLCLSASLSLSLSVSILSVSQPLCPSASLFPSSLFASRISLLRSSSLPPKSVFVSFF